MVPPIFSGKQNTAISQNFKQVLYLCKGANNLRSFAYIMVLLALLAFLVNLKLPFSMGSWNLSSCSQTFQKMQRATNFSEGTNSKFPWIYIGSVQAFWKTGGCHRMINVKTTFMHVTLKINQFNISSDSQILQKLLGELMSEGELII